MPNFLVTVATTVYNNLMIEVDSRKDACWKGMNSSPNFSEGYVVETPYIKNVEELDA